MTFLKPVGITTLILATAFFSIVTMHEWNKREKLRPVAARASTEQSTKSLLQDLPVLPLSNTVPTIDPTRNLVASLPELASSFERFRKRRYYIDRSLKTAGGDIQKQLRPVTD